MGDGHWIGREGETPIPLAESVTLEENGTFILAAPGAQEVWLGERRLSRDGDHWLIPVGYWASQRRLVLRIDGPAGVRRLPVVVRPASHKLTPEQWTTMVDEIEQLLAGSCLGAEGGVHGSVSSQALAEGVRIEVLTTLVPPLLRAVMDLVRNPRRREDTAEEDVARHQLRRVDHSAARALARGASRIPSNHLTEPLDHPANRWIAHQLRAVHRALRAAADRLATQVAHHALDADPVAWAHARGARCSDAAGALENLLASTFLGRMTPGGAGESVLPVLAGDPVYARVHRLARVLLHPRFRLDEDGPGAALRPSFTLWELWCFKQAVAERCSALPGFIRKDDLAALHGPTGEGATVTLTSADGLTGCSIHFNQTFAALADGPRFALSREFRPDIVIREWTPAGRGWRALDAKWRVGRAAVGDSFDSVHRYRDALVDEDWGGRAVSVLLVVPRRSDAHERWFDPGWQAKWGMGVVSWAPGQALSTASLAS